MSYRERERPKARRLKNQSLEPNKNILVVCEGVTEESYINWYRNKCRSKLVKVKIADNNYSTPRELVNFAKELQLENRRESKKSNNIFVVYDEIWCVFDRDKHPYFENAIQKAKANDLKLAISVPCFELWLYLHLYDNPGMQNHTKMLEILKKYKPSYEKGNKFNFEENFTGKQISEAIKRSKALQKQAELDNEDYRNPVTYMFALCESIADNNSWNN